jgi:hypothetical protein
MQTSTLKQGRHNRFRVPFLSVTKSLYGCAMNKSFAAARCIFPGRRQRLFGPVGRAARRT